MVLLRRLLLMAMLLDGSTAWGQPNPKEPRIGYLYPAGGQQGTTFEVLVGGQQLKGVTDVHISGEGVSAAVIQHYRPVRNLNAEQRQELQKRLRELSEKRRAELPRNRLGPAADGRKKNSNRKNNNPVKAEQQTVETTTQPVKLPEHPLLRDLESKSLRELQHIKDEFFNLGKRQLNTQIAELVLLEITIDREAARGDREIRLATPAGLTNPMVFQVGSLPEACEQEPNDPNSYPNLPAEPPLDLPVLMNGQIKPGDIDRFRFRAKRGQQLVIETQARHLIPYLADAVPGWFQATVALYNEQGKEVAFADDYRFNPDPVLFYRIPETGEYELELRDALYRGREDFIYRITVGEHPFITRAFPLGGQEGVRTVASIDGWNLSKDRLLLNTQPGAEDIRQTALHRYGRLSNQMIYAVDTLPEYSETEPNNTLADAQQIDLPQIVNGRIAQPGDVDIFRFEGRAGDAVVAEVFARRLNSPLDSLLRLTDASGRVLEWNDDHEDKESGLSTHHADSFLHTRLPEDGIYLVHLADVQNHGGKAHAYRLRIGPPRPDFALRLTPSSINMRAGGIVPVWVHAVRKDGFDGDIDLVLKDAPPGFALSGERIPAGRDHIRMTLTAPPRPLDQPIALQLEGLANIDGQEVHRRAVPAEDMMQAFLYRHLAPSQELLVTVIGRHRGPPVEWTEREPVRVPTGGAARIQIRTPKRSMLRDVQLELREPPAGMSLQDVTVVSEGLAFMLKADEDAPPVGFADNLIVEAFTETADQKRDGKAPTQKRRVSLGILPALAFEIVQQ